MDIPMMNEIFEKMDETTAAAVAQIMEKLASGGSVKSVQRGVISFKTASATATINAVDMNKSIVVPGGIYTIDNNQYSNGEEPFYWSAALELTNSTTVTAKRLSDSNVSTVCPYQVVEFY